MRFKTNIFIPLFLFTTSLFSQSWMSLDSLSGDSNVIFWSYEISKTGSFYITGSGHNNSTFKNYIFNNGNRNTNFIAKLDANQNLIWLKEMPTATNQNTNRIALDANSNIYYVLYTMTDCVIGGNNVNYRNGENIITRLDSNGNILKVYNFGDRYIGGLGGNNAAYYSMSLKNENFISILFTYNDTAYLANDTLHASFPGIENYAILNVDSNLNEISHMAIHVSVSNIKYNNDGVLYMVGQYSNVGTFIWNNIILPSSCSSTGYIAKLDSLCNPQWVKYINAVDTCAYGQIAYGASFGSLDFDKNNNIYATGFYMGNADYSGLSLNYNSNNGTLANYFYTKIDDMGNVSWCKTLHSPYGSWGNSLVVDSCGNASVIGSFGGPIATTGSYTLMQQYPSYQERSLMVIDYDYNGNVTNMLMGESHFNNFSIKSMPGYAQKNYIIGNCEWYIPHFGNLSFPSANDYNVVFTTEYTPNYSCNSSKISTIKNSNNFHLFPIPCNNEIILSTDIQYDNVKYELIDVFGSIIQSGFLRNNNTALQTANLANGFYSLRIENINGVKEILKVIVVHQ